MEHERGPQRIPGYEIGGGSDRADKALEDISRMFGGYTPNIHKVMANSPAMIEAFESFRRLMQHSKLRHVEREIISIEVSRRAGCDYCMTAHTWFARRYKVSEEDIVAAKTGQPMSNPRFALVQRAAQTILDRRGRLTKEELSEFQAAGMGNDELLETIAVIGWYVISTYTNNLANTAIDDYWLR